MPDTPTDPVLPSAVVAHAGTQPLNKLLDLNGDGVPDYEQRWFRDRIAGGLFKLLSFVFPNAPWAMVLKQYETAITRLIETGSK